MNPEFARRMGLGGTLADLLSAFSMPAIPVERGGRFVRPRKQGKARGYDGGRVYRGGVAYVKREGEWVPLYPRAEVPE